MDEELLKNLQACVGASVPCIAITTTETEEIIKQVSEYSAKYSYQGSKNQKRRRSQHGRNEYPHLTLIDAFSRFAHGKSFFFRKCSRQRNSSHPCEAIEKVRHNSS